MKRERNDLSWDEMPRDYYTWKERWARDPDDRVGRWEDAAWEFAKLQAWADTGLRSQIGGGDFNRMRQQLKIDASRIGKDETWQHERQSHFYSLALEEARMERNSQAAQGIFYWRTGMYARKGTRTDMIASIQSETLGIDSRTLAEIDKQLAYRMETPYTDYE